MNLNNILATLLIIIIALVLKVSFTKILNNSTKFSPQSRRKLMLSKVMHIAIFIITIISTLGIWEVKPEDLAIYFASVFTIIGVAFFAQWSHLSNITASVIIFLTSPVKIGDNIKIYENDGIKGLIVDMGLFFTTIITEDNEKLMLSNTFFLQKLWSVQMSSSLKEPISLSTETKEKSSND